MRESSVEADRSSAGCEAPHAEGLRWRGPPCRRLDLVRDVVPWSWAHNPSADLRWAWLRTGVVLLATRGPIVAVTMEGSATTTHVDAEVGTCCSHFHHSLHISLLCVPLWDSHSVRVSQYQWYTVELK